MKRYFIILAAVLMYSAVCAWAESNTPVIAVIPFEAAGVSQNDADAFTARFTEILAANETVSVVESRAVNTLLARQEIAISDLIDEKRAVAFATEANADFLIIGNLFALGNMAGVFITLIGVNPITVSVAMRQEESMDALMATVPGMCKELLENVEK